MSCSNCLLYVFQYVCLLIEIDCKLKFFTEEKDYKVLSRKNKKLSGFLDFKMQFVLNHQVAKVSTQEVLNILY